MSGINWNGSLNFSGTLPQPSFKPAAVAPKQATQQLVPPNEPYQQAVAKVSNAFVSTPLGDTKAAKDAITKFDNDTRKANEALMNYALDQFEIQGINT